MLRCFTKTMNVKPLLALMGIPIIASCGYVGDKAVTGSGVIKSEPRSLSAYHGIELSAAADVTTTVGPNPSVTIKTDDNLLPLVRTEVKDGILYISTTQPINANHAISIVATAPSLDSVRVSGAGAIHASGVHGKAFSAKVDGAASIVVSGEADSVKGEINGAGDLKLFDLAAKTAETTINGAGNIEVNAKESVSGSINGVGSLRYKGNPKVSVTKNGVGSIKPA